MSKSAILVTLLLPLALISCDKEERLQFKKGELFYNKNQITEPIAHKVGDALVKDSMFTDDRESSAKLMKPDSIYQLMLVMNKRRSTPDVIADVSIMAIDFSEDALGGAPLDVIMTDSSWLPFHTESYRTLGKFLMAKQGRLFYSTEVGLGAATKFRDFLVEFGFYDGGEKIAKLEKTPSGYAFDLFSDAGPRSKERQDVLRTQMAEWSRTVFGGTPITLRLCDIHMRPFLEIAPASKLPA